jgi:hypothetical protein
VSNEQINNSDEADADRHWDIAFPVRRSIRYHNARQSFFENWHRFTSFASVLVSSAASVAFFSAYPKELTASMLFFVAALNAIELVVNTSKLALLHDSLKKQFISLEMNLLAGVDKLSEVDYIAACKARLAIENQEPPVLHYVNLQCHNEIIQSTPGFSKEDKKKAFVNITLWQKLSKNFVLGNPVENIV